jgi:hypothetical protein
MNIQLYRNGAAHLLLPIDENTVFSQAVMGEHIITCSFISDAALDINEGDYIEFRGERFTINRPLPPVDKESSADLTYNITFEGYIYNLLDMPYMHLGSLEFSYFGTPRMYLQILIDCMNSIDPGWTIGEVDDADEVAMDFFESGKGYSCKGALIKIAEAFKLEFWLVGKTINLTAMAGRFTGLKFECGRGRGLYKVSRGQIDDVDYFNRLYIQGSDKNIPYGYRNGAKRLQIDVPYLELPLTGGSKRRAKSVVIDDIFPKRVGTITSVGDDWLSITDDSINFDINGKRIEGVKATVEILSGENGGQSFEIGGYNSSTKTITLLPIVEADGYVRPNNTFSINPGDKYFLAGIDMPQTYVETAEADLKERGSEILNDVKRKTPPYSVEVDPKYMRDNGIRVNAGDRVIMQDEDLEIDANIRVSSVKLPLVNPDKITFVLSDVIPLSITEKVIVEIDKAKQDVITIDKNRLKSARENWKATEELATLLDALRAEMLLIMVDGGAYTTDIVAKTTKDTFSTSAGTVYHEQFTEHDGIWNVPAYQTSLANNQAYYVYIKARKADFGGQIVLSASKIGPNSDPDVYYIPFGIISSIIEGTRIFSSTKGYTAIVGDNIRTGRIVSNDGYNYFDLTTNSFNLGTAANGLDYNVTKPNTLTLRGALFQSGSGVVAPVPVYRGPYNATATYYKGDSVTYNGTTFLYVNDQPAAGQTPADNEFWDITSAAGTPGSPGTPGTPGAAGNYTEFRFAKNTSSTTAPTLTNTATAPTGWTTTQPTLATGEFMWVTSVTKVGATGALVGTWSVPARMNGTNGTNGTGSAGAAGNYMEFRFQKNGSTTAAPSLVNTDTAPTGWTIAQPTLAAAEYLWMTSAMKNGTTNALIGTWSTPVRVNGLPGTPGRDGTNGTNGTNGGPGPSLTYTGVYSSTKTYQGNANLVQAVYYNGNYYFTRSDAGSFSNILPTNTTKWNAAGAQFDSIATGLLLAQLAYIDNLGVRYLSTNTPGNKRVVIDGDQNNLRLYSASDLILAELDDDSAVRVTPADINNGVTLRETTAGLGMTNGAGDKSTMSAFGFYTTGTLTIGAGNNPLIIDQNGIRGANTNAGTIAAKTVTAPYSLQSDDNTLVFTSGSAGYTFVLPTTDIPNGREVTVRGSGYYPTVNASGTNYQLGQAIISGLPLIGLTFIFIGTRWYTKASLVGAV